METINQLGCERGFQTSWLTYLTSIDQVLRKYDQNKHKEERLSSLKHERIQHRNEQRFSSRKYGPTHQDERLVFFTIA